MQRRNFLLASGSVASGLLMPQTSDDAARRWVFDSALAEVVLRPLASSTGEYEAMVQFKSPVHADWAILRAFYPVKIGGADAVLSDYTVAPCAGMKAYGGGDKPLRLSAKPLWIRVTLVREVAEFEIGKRPE